jgi:acetylornithine/N-succinyldiaminopimelate aminotransferase
MAGLNSEKLHNDPRIKQAKELIAAALTDAQADITGPRPAMPELAAKYDELVQRTSAARGANIYYRYLGSGIGKGALVELADGSIKYDFITGIGVHYFGHSCPEIVNSGIDAAISDTVMQGHLQQNTDQMMLMETFLDLAQKNGADLAHCFLTSTGATANENALKLQFQKNYPANRMLAFNKCFAGRTLALAQMTDKHVYRDGLPVAMQVDYLPFYDCNDHDGSITRALAILQSHLDRFPKSYAGMCFELIQGEGGYFPGNREFFVAIMKVLKENNIAVWIDEVQSFGRTTEAFAFQHFNLDEYVDLVTVGKMSQVCATFFTENFKPRPGLISQTFTSSTAAIRASQVVLDKLKSGELTGLSGRIMQLHNRFAEGFRSLSGKFKGDFTGPYGLGGMVAFTIFNGDLAKTKDFTNKLFDNGVISFIAGKNPTRVRFLMPVMAIDEKDIDNVVEIIGKTFEEMN